MTCSAGTSQNSLSTGRVLQEESPLLSGALARSAKLQQSQPSSLVALRSLTSDFRPLIPVVRRQSSERCPLISDL
jgi:hypothetical protein